MDPTLTFSAIAGSTALTTTMGFLFAGLTAVGGASVLVPYIARKILPTMKETHLADFIPFESIAPDGQTVIMRDQSVARYFFVAGKDQAFMNSEEAIGSAYQRKAFLDGLAESGATIRIFTTRQKIDVPQSSGFPNDLAREVADRWNEQFAKAFSTLNIICLSAKNQSKLSEAQQVLETTLHSYGISTITQNEDGNPARLTLGKFLGSLTAPASLPAPNAFGSNLGDVLAGDVVWFRPDGLIEFSQGQKRRYAVALSIKKLGEDMSSALTNDLTALPLEMTILKHIQPMSKTIALIKLEQSSRIAGITSFNPAVAEQFEAAKAFVEGLDEQKSSLCTYSSVIFIYGDSIEEILESEDVVRKVISTNGAVPVRETGATQATWFMQFPTMDVIPRPYRIFTYSIAFDYTLDKPSPGIANSDWGKGPISLFHTSSGTVYQHQFHETGEKEAVGHGIVIAPTGVGKTVLMEFMSLMASRHKNVKHFFFDRYQGTAIYNLAMGGKYLSMNSDPLPWSVKSGMNPFDCEDTQGNRAFIKDWMSSIARVEEDDQTSLTEISNAVDIAFEEMDRSERSLVTIHEATFAKDSKVYKELMRWVSPTQYGPIFNAQRDTIDIDGNWLTTFDMTRLLDDKDLGAATVSYLLHRIRGTMAKEADPGFIFIDETAPLLENEHFRRLFRIALLEFRKLRGVVMCVFQSPETLAQTGESKLILSQVGTYYLFQNQAAKAQDYKDFDLTDKELDFVLGRSAYAHKAKRSLLIKRAKSKESVIVDVDLSRLGPKMRIFSSGSESVKLVSDLYRQFEGKWLEKYIHDEAS